MGCPCFKHGKRAQLGPSPCGVQACQVRDACAQDAYAALQANPVPERRLEELQRLLGALCALGDVGALLRLPLAGVAQVQRGGRCGPAGQGFIIGSGGV